MKVKFQYTDWDEWEGSPENAYLSPDKGVVRMIATDDFDRTVTFLYDDFYYVCPVGDGSWWFGSNTPSREFRIVPGLDGAIPRERISYPAGSVIRTGQLLSDADAIAFGLTDVDGKFLTPPRDDVTLEIG